MEPQPAAILSTEPTPRLQSSISIQYMNTEIGAHISNTNNFSLENSSRLSTEYLNADSHEPAARPCA
jgi:hypothetical protein